MNTSAVDNVEDYIKSKSFEIQDALFEIRKIIFSKAPNVEEFFSYGMPSYKLKGQPLVFFGAFKKNIALYALPTGHSLFAEKLNGYTQSKGSVQFPLKQPLPFDLIAELVELRVNQILGNL